MTTFLVPEVWKQALVDYVTAPRPQWQRDMSDRAFEQMKAERAAKRAVSLIYAIRRLQEVI